MGRKTFYKIAIAILALLIVLFFYIMNVLKHDKEKEQLHFFGYMVSRLESIVYAEQTWYMQDCDMNGIKDYWTYDVSCLHRMYRPDNRTKVSLIHEHYANADGLPADSNNQNFFGDEPKIAPLSIIEPPYGWYFRAMLIDEKGIPYSQNPVGTKKILATNPNKFAFVAYPAVYGESVTTYTFIVNEKKEIYVRDMGSDKNKIVLQWPSQEELTKWEKVSY